jgi:hypothetical protein
MEVKLPKENNKKYTISTPIQVSFLDSPYISYFGNKKCNLLKWLVFIHLNWCTGRQTYSPHRNVCYKQSDLPKKHNLQKIYLYYCILLYEMLLIKVNTFMKHGQKLCPYTVVEILCFDVHLVRKDMDVNKPCLYCLYSVCNGFFTCMHVGFFQLYVHDFYSTWNTYPTVTSARSCNNVGHLFWWKKKISVRDFVI